MSWLDRIDEQEARRMARKVGRTASETGDMALERLQQFAHDATGVAREAIRHIGDDGREQRARRLARDLRDGAYETGEIARDHLEHFAHDAKKVVGRTANELVGYGRREGMMLAQEAAKRAVRSSRAVKADPVPAIVGVIGIALFANLLMSRRSQRRTTRS